MTDRWAFRFDDDRREQVAFGSSAIFSDGPFRGRMEHVHIRPGFSLCVVEGISSQPYIFSAEGISAPGSLVLGNMLGGAGRITTEGAGEHSWRDQHSLFALTPETPVAYHIEPRRKWAVAGLVMAPGVLSEFTEDDCLPDNARKIIRGRGPFSVMRPIGDKRRAQLATDLMRTSYTGRMAHLYRQAKCLEFLGSMLEALGDEGPGSLSARDMLRVRQARDRLLADLRNPPDLYDLAHVAGLSVKRLNEGFRALFGATAFEYLRDARLDAARDILFENRDLPLKQIAWQVGYSHSTNFINAYRRRFGVSPNRHRRDRPLDS